MEEILNVENLKTYFYLREGLVKAVDDVSFSLKKGETLGIVGESGSGKSVTALSILRLIKYPPGKIVNGKIRIDGVDLLRFSNNEMRKMRGNDIAMIFQDPMTSLNPVFTVGQQITESIIIHQKLKKNEAREKAISLLKSVGINDPAGRILRYPHEFSGGMRQRVMIAIALACNPRVLIADEPTTALDVTIQAQIIELLNNLKKDIGSSIIIITHDLGVIAEMADNVLVMYGGKIMEYGSAETIFYSTLHPYTMGLLKSIPNIDRKVDRLIPIRGNPPSMMKMPEGCPFNSRCDYVKDICYKVVPPLESSEKNHKYACHLKIDELNNIRLQEKVSYAKGK